MRRIAITGSSGYVGRRLVEAIRRDVPDAVILGLDRVPPRQHRPDQFESIEICEPRLAEVLADFATDTIIHLAFVLNPIHPEVEMQRVNVEGTRKTLLAAAAVKPDRFLFVSSAVVFGARPENPVPIDDGYARNPHLEFRYAADKSEAERLVAEFAELHPNVAASWVRPAIILGPGVDNYLSRLLLRWPVVLLLDGHNTPMQFVHVDDVVAAIVHILTRDGRGPYNLAPGDSISQLEIALETRRKVMRVPLWLAGGVCRFCWFCRLPVLGAPATLLDYLRHPWVVAPRRLTGELGFAFRSTSRDALRSVLGATMAG